MAEQDLKQVMLDAILDADSLERFINGDDTQDVLTRLSAEYPTLRKAIKQMFENGGLPATPFATKALMEASPLVDGDYALVTDDTTDPNNGLYVKTLDKWGKTKLLQPDLRFLIKHSSLTPKLEFGGISYVSGSEVASSTGSVASTDFIEFDGEVDIQPVNPDTLVRIHLYDKERVFLGTVRPTGEIGIYRDYLSEYTSVAIDGYFRISVKYIEEDTLTEDDLPLMSLNVSGRSYHQELAVSDTLTQSMAYTDNEIARASARAEQDNAFENVRFPAPILSENIERLTGYSVISSKVGDDTVYELRVPSTGINALRVWYRVKVAPDSKLTLHLIKGNKFNLHGTRTATSPSKLARMREMGEIASIKFDENYVTALYPEVDRFHFTNDGSIKELWWYVSDTSTDIDPVVEVTDLEGGRSEEYVLKKDKILRLDDNPNVILPKGVGGLGDIQDLPNSKLGLNSNQLWRDKNKLAYGQVVQPQLDEEIRAAFGSHVEIYAFLDLLVTDFPDYVSKFTSGTSVLGVPIYGYRLKPKLFNGYNSPSFTDESRPLPKAIINGGIHGDETHATVAAMYFIDDICRQWQNIESYDEMRWGMDIVYIPLVNPDGYNANTRENSNTIDLNRDYTTETPQIETTAMKALILEHPDAFTCISNHRCYPQSASVWVGTNNLQLNKYLWKYLRDMSIAVRRLVPSLAEDTKPLVTITQTPPTGLSSWATRNIDGVGVLLETPSNVGVGGTNGRPTIVHARDALAYLVWMLYIKKVKDLEAPL